MLCLFFFGQQSLRLKSSHASRSGARDSLSISLVLDVTGCEKALHIRLGCSWYSEDVALSIGVDLAFDKLSCGSVTYMSSNREK